MNKNDRMQMTRPESAFPSSHGSAPSSRAWPLLLTLALWTGSSGFAGAETDPGAQGPASGTAAAARPLPSAPSPGALTRAPNWTELSPAQKILLAPLESEWAGLGPDRRIKWLGVAAKLPSLPPDEQARMQERMRDWARLSPDERRQARIGWQTAKQVGSDERQAKWEAYQALPAERRQELADKAARKQAAAALPPVSKPLVGTQTKSNLVPPVVKLPVPTAATATLLQAKPGASTVLMTRTPSLPPHQFAGQTKVVADPDLVNPQTLLPKSLKAPIAASAAG